MTDPALRDGEDIVATTSELIGLAGVGGEEPRTLDWIAAWLSDRGVAIERSSVSTAQLSSHPFYSVEIERDTVEMLVARVGRSEGRSLLVNVHVDVVAAAGQRGWTSDPFTATRRGEWVYGRGAADTLGGLAAAMHLMADLVDADLAGQVILTPVVGEEDGGCGTLATLVAGVRADASVVIEPTGLDVARASAGALCFRVTVPGRTAHGSVRHEGVSAIEKGWVIHRALLELEAERATRRHLLYSERNPFPLCIGRIEGGDYRCDEAAWLHLEGRFGTSPAEPVKRARAELEAAVARAAEQDPWLREHPPVVEWIGAQWVGGDTPADAPIVAAVRAADPAAALVGMSYGCDMGLLRQVADIPTVVYGPGDAAVAHAPDERVRVADLEQCRATLDRLARDWCGTSQ